MRARCHSRILLWELTSSLIVDFGELSLVVDDEEGWRRGTVEVVQSFEFGHEVLVVETFGHGEISLCIRYDGATCVVNPDAEVRGVLVGVELPPTVLARAIPEVEHVAIDVIHEHGPHGIAQCVGPRPGRTRVCGARTVCWSRSFWMKWWST